MKVVELGLSITYYLLVVIFAFAIVVSSSSCILNTPLLIQVVRFWSELP